MPKHLERVVMFISSVTLIPRKSPSLFKSPATFVLPSIVIRSQLSLNWASHCHLALLITPWNTSVLVWQSVTHSSFLLICYCSSVSFPSFPPPHPDPHFFLYQMLENHRAQCSIIFYFLYLFPGDLIVSQWTLDTIYMRNP